MLNTFSELDNYKNTNKSKPKVILLLGGPGSGKGTQGKKVEENFSYIHLSMGDLMRQTKNNEIDTYNKDLSSNKITSLTHELSLNLLRNVMIEKGWNKEKFILDGFHRKFDEYDFKLMSEIDIEMVLVFVPSTIETLKSRIEKRYEEYKDSEHLRKHDLEILEKRMKIYQTETQEVIKFYADNMKEKVFYLNCDKSIEEVFQDIKSLIEKNIKS